MTPEQQEILARAWCFGQQGYDDDWEDVAIEGSDLVAITRATLDEFLDAARTVWREASGRQMFALSGCPCVFWESVQATKGQPRRSLVLVDFGDFRATYSV